MKEKEREGREGKGENKIDIREKERGEKWAREKSRGRTKKS